MMPVVTSAVVRVLWNDAISMGESRDSRTASVLVPVCRRYSNLI